MQIKPVFGIIDVGNQNCVMGFEVCIIMTVKKVEESEL
jgi:hypothetical protein